MKRTLVFLLLLSVCGGCKDKEFVSPEIKATPCVSPYKDTSRHRDKVVDQPGMVIGNKIFPLLPLEVPPYDFSLRTSLLPCNLPEKFRKDSLLVSVSGYYLTSPLLETIQISSLPFELTDIELRE